MSFQGGSGGILPGVFTTVLLFLCIALSIHAASVKELREQLAEANKRRDKLQTRVSALDDKLILVRKALDRLTKGQAPKAQVEAKRKQIRELKAEKQKFQTSLFQAEEQRVDVLEELNLASPPIPPATDGADAKPPSNEELLAKAKERVEGNISPLPATGFGVGSETKKPNTQDALAGFRQKLDALKVEQKKLEAEITYELDQKKKADEKFRAAKFAKNEEKAQYYHRESNALDAKAAMATKKLAETRAKFLKMKQEFEGYVATQARTDYIMPGQKLELIVAEDKSFNGKYTVRPGGYIILPRIGRITIAGKAHSEAENTVKKVLEQTQLRTATVLLEPVTMDDPEFEKRQLEKELLKARIKHWRGGEEGDIGQDVIYLTGAFKKPKPWPIPKGFDPTLLTTVIRAGGVREDADLENVRVLRTVQGRPVSETMNMKALMEGKPNVLDIRLKPNDVIIIPEAAKKKPQSVFLTGNVKKPGPFELTFDKPVTAYTVVLKAGGFSRFANLKGVFILRQNGSGKKIRIPVNMKKVKSGEATDPEVKPNDIIVVPESFWGIGN